MVLYVLSCLLLCSSVFGSVIPFVDCWQDHLKNPEFLSVVPFQESSSYWLPILIPAHFYSSRVSREINLIHVFVALSQTSNQKSKKQMLCELNTLWV